MLTNIFAIYSIMMAHLGIMGIFIIFKASKRKFILNDIDVVDAATWRVWEHINAMEWERATIQAWTISVRCVTKFFFVVKINLIFVHHEV